MFVIGSLLISEKEERFSLRRTVSAAVLTTLALGGYPPVINLIAVAFSVRLLFAALFEIPSPAAATPGTPLPLSLPAVLKTLCRRFRWTAFNLLLGAACYKLCLWGSDAYRCRQCFLLQPANHAACRMGRKISPRQPRCIAPILCHPAFYPAAYKAAAGIVVLAGIAAALLRIFAPFRTNAPAALSAASGATVSASVADTAAANSDTPDMPYSFRRCQNLC